jgi:dsRNA-specific ribonuclease
VAWLWDLSHMRADDFQKQPLELEGWAVTVTSYRIGGQYVVEVETISSGVTVARANHESRAIAKEQAIETALRRLARTRRIDLDLMVGG